MLCDDVHVFSLWCIGTHCNSDVLITPKNRKEHFHYLHNFLQFYVYLSGWWQQITSFCMQTVAATQNANLLRGLCHLKSKLSTSKIHRIIYMGKKSNNKRSKNKGKRQRADTRANSNMHMGFAKKFRGEQQLANTRPKPALCQQGGRRGSAGASCAALRSASGLRSGLILPRSLQAVLHFPSACLASKTQSIRV